MRVAMAQVSSTADPSANLDAVRAGIADAAAHGADLVVFPEASMCRFGVRLDTVAEPLDGQWATAVRAAAVEQGIAVVVGMFTPGDIRGDRRRIRNTLLIVGADGNVEHYDKIHLYDAFGFAESDTVQPGSEPVTVTVTGETVGVATCYDVRFPELFARLADREARLIVLPASWGAGAGKLEQWRLLTTARALDVQAWVVAVDQALPDDPDASASSAPTGIGHSVLSSPHGVPIAEFGDGPELRVFDIDLEEASAAREAMAVAANRRLQPTGPVQA
ncbi:nitrilase-related carbon-nitrogen hydrolase [Williamsia sterculiae]|uniref:Predicted amidohydrolase n=1 Tax=Williamsia sterculiae TaxID=1344003 RepID=A0A1N7GZC6_9NOCA|nr:nitrilase-related carbon-nitrogen hydrolase [Williamsia sterculiae]SIS17939.1 Predicted amidohydrolase [Williamsia sterculiae]